MTETRTERRFIDGVLTDVEFTETSATPVASPTALYDICIAEFADLGMTDASVPGNATLDGLATKISTQAENDGLLI